MASGLSQTEARPEARAEALQDAADVAGGSGVVVIAGLFDQASRFTVTWYLSGLLGPAGFGAYAQAITFAMLLGTLAPMGLNLGVVLFGARHRDDPPRLKGTVFASLGLGSLSGLAFATALLVAALARPAWFGEAGLAVVAAAPVVLLLSLLFVLLGVLRSVRDLRSAAIAHQIGLSSTLLLLIALLGPTAAGAVALYAVATLVAVLLAGWFVWRRFGALLADRTIPAPVRLRELLAFSIPQGLVEGVFRLTTWVDVLLLAALATLADVGVYRVAASLALFASLPIMAVQIALNPVAASLVQKGELGRLDGLVKTATRWLLIGMVPPFLVLLVAPEAVLWVFEAEYAAARAPLAILAMGQAVAVLCAATGSLNPMAGRSWLELLDGIVALALTVALQLLLVPRMGATGAAVASAVGMIAWVALRVVQGRWLLGCFPFDGRNLLLLACALGLGAGAALAASTVGPALAVVLASLVWAGVVWAMGIAPGDHAIVAVLRQRIGR